MDAFFERAEFLALRCAASSLREFSTARNLLISSSRAVLFFPGLKRSINWLSFFPLAIAMLNASVASFKATDFSENWDFILRASIDVFSASTSALSCLFVSFAKFAFPF